MSRHYFLLLALVAAACGGDASPTAPEAGGSSSSSAAVGAAVPTELVRTWINGSVSSSNFYNASTGSWTSAYGEGLFYRFRADGTFEYGFQMSSTLYGCTERFDAYKRGVIKSVDVAQHTIDLVPQVHSLHSQSNCVAANNYEKKGDLAGERLIWDWETDQYGNRYLKLRHPDGGFSAFRGE